MSRQLGADDQELVRGSGQLDRAARFGREAVGEPGAGGARLDALVRVWSEAGFNVRAFEDIDRMVWEKFLCNVTLSAPTAAFDVTVGELEACDLEAAEDLCAPESPECAEVNGCLDECAG